MCILNGDIHRLMVWLNGLTGMTKMNFNRILFILLLVLINCNLLGQSTSIENLPYFQALGRRLHPSEIINIQHIQKPSGHYSTYDWTNVIDRTWGPGLSTTEKLRIFDLVWNNIDQNYGGFVNFNVDIDSLKQLWRPEIEEGVSRGRFAGIMSHFILALNEGHTMIADIPVSYGTFLKPGVPILVISDGFGDHGHFGAVLTPLPDSSSLVINVLPNHELGLVVGDIVLGYNGIPWKFLYKQLIEAQLPIQNRGVGSTNESMTHILLASAGLNWHLFSTIDIVKYSTGDTLHLSTAPLKHQYLHGSIWGNEQLKVPGVPMPDYLNDDYVSWGLVDGTSIGYIYVGAWYWNGYKDKNYDISVQFYNAVDSLMHHHQTTGMIIDFRCNGGGSSGVRNDGYSLLFNRRLTEWGFVERGDSANHFHMVPHTDPVYENPEYFSIPGDPVTYYNKPIAVLTGPSAGSAGDWSSLEMRFHPMVRTFGKPSNGAFSTLEQPYLGYPYWQFTYATGSGILLDYPDDYLIHTGAPIDEKVWLTQEDVARGKDTVVETSIQWINSITDETKKNHIPYVFYLGHNYPNPFNSSTTIHYELPRPTHVILYINNAIGQKIRTLVNERKPAGTFSIVWNGKTDDGSAVSSGVYVYRIQAGDFKDAKKLLLLQ